MRFTSDSTSGLGGGRLIIGNVCDCIAEGFGLGLALLCFANNISQLLHVDQTYNRYGSGGTTLMHVPSIVHRIFNFLPSFNLHGPQIRLPMYESCDLYQEVSLPNPHSVPYPHPRWLPCSLLNRVR